MSGVRFHHNSLFTKGAVIVTGVSGFSATWLAVDPLHAVFFHGFVFVCAPENINTRNTYRHTPPELRNFVSTGIAY